MDTTTAPMTETEALDEALLLFIRKTRRALRTADPLDFGNAFNALWAKLPDGAKTALLRAEGRADRHRNTADGVRSLVWPVEADLDESETADAA